MSEFKIDVPHYVKVYCRGRKTEIMEYLTEKQFSRLIRIHNLSQWSGNKTMYSPIDNDNILVQVLGGEEGCFRCLITRKVRPLTVMKKPILLRAAELEYKTHSFDPPISLQEARWLLIDEFPETNNTAQPNSCIKLIEERRGTHKLSLSETVRKSAERKVVCTV